MHFSQSIKVLLGLFLFPFCIYCQEVKFHAPIGSISQNTITTIAQDDYGFLWFGTQYGLNRYNGVDFTTYLHSPTDSLSISNSSIESLMCDSEGNIWVGTYGGGVNILNRKTQSWNKGYGTIQKNLNGHYISVMYEDRAGGIWIGTEKNGLKYWDKKTDEIRHFIARKEKYKLSSNYITGITEGENGELWIATWGGGICKLDKERSQFDCYKSDASIDLPRDNVIRSFYKGKDGWLWIGTHQGIRKINISTEKGVVFENIETPDKKLFEQLQKAIVLNLIEDSQSQLWIGTENKGLFLYDIKTKSLRLFKYDPNSKYSINSNSIWSLFEDSFKTVWVGTFKNGIRKVDRFEQKFGLISDDSKSKVNISNGLVSAFAEDENGNIWVGTDGGGLDYLEREEQTFVRSSQIKEGLDSKQIVCLLNDRNGNLWVGSWGGGLYLKEKNSATFKSMNSTYVNSDMPFSNEIKNLYEDGKGNIWISSFRNGLDLYDPQTNAFYHYSSGTSNKEITSAKIRDIVQDEQGYYWLGAQEGGLDRVRFNENYEITEVKNFIYNKNNPSGISNNSINVLHLDSKNQLWIGTDGGGLEKYHANTESFEHITEKDGLPSNVVYGILEADGLIWISTNNGLASYDMAEGSVQTYDMTDGLQANEFNTAAAKKLKDGMLLFGGINGFNYFSPKEINKNKTIPKVYITQLKISDYQKEGKSESTVFQMPENEIILNHTQNDLRFDFTALNYSQSTKNQYVFQLENHNLDWQAAGGIHHASYANLRPGSYTFKVKASNNDGVWNEEATSLRVVIRQPWYKTKLAYFAYVLLFGGLLFSINKMLINRERLNSQLKIEHMELNKMQELDAVKSQFFANISHEFKTPLTLIISPLKAMHNRVGELKEKEYLNLMLRNSERLLRLINQILSLSKLESGTLKLKTFEQDIVIFTKQISTYFHGYAEELSMDFNLNLPEEPIKIYFEKEKMEAILINLLSNAFKYTPQEGTINLTINREEKFVKITISDSGIGLSPDQVDLIFNRFYRAKDRSSKTGTGIGLSLTKQLVELHGGKIEATSVQREGSTFEVFFPYGRNHLTEEQVEIYDTPYNLSEDALIELRDFNISPKVAQIEEEGNANPVVLIAEDNRDLRSFTKTYLQTNYEILEAVNGNEAYEMIQEHIPDILVTDVMMPLMDGFELCKKVKTNEKTSHIFIIMLTAKSSEESIEQGYEYGADYYITKPFNPKFLEMRINNVLQTKLNLRKQTLANVLTVSNNKNTFATEEVKQVKSKDEIFLEKIVALIESRLDDSGFTVLDICKEMGFSKSQLYRKLKSVVGQSANEFVRSIRLKKAAEMLLNEDMTVAEITYSVGFNDLQYFRKCFKKQYGVTPSEYSRKGG